MRKLLSILFFALLFVETSLALSITRRAVLPEFTDFHFYSVNLPQLVYVEGGSFDMGGADGESDERPLHRVTVDEYYIGAYEVTQGLWYDVMGQNPSYFQGSRSAYSTSWRELPVENVSWNDCQAFLDRLNSLRSTLLPADVQNWTFRFPTEAEWEYAARGGRNSRNTYSGSNNIDEAAWYRDNSGRGLSAGYNSDHIQTHPVGTKRGCPLGSAYVYDMTGNVWEWCLDWYDSSYYSRSPQRNPCNTVSASDRVRRGGCWGDRAQYCRVANRDYNSPDNRGNYNGMRLVLAP